MRSCPARMGDWPSCAAPGASTCSAEDPSPARRPNRPWCARVARNAASRSCPAIAWGRRTRSCTCPKRTDGSRSRASSWSPRSARGPAVPTSPITSSSGSRPRRRGRGSLTRVIAGRWSAGSRNRPARMPEVRTEEGMPVGKKGKGKRGLSSAFNHFAKHVSRWSGRPATFVGAVVVILAWGVTGPIFHFSDTWQLVINTTTTIVTFLMVFLIQNQQTRDTEALQVKLDELLRVSTGQNVLMDLEELDEDELETIRQEYLALAKKARDEQEERRTARKS